MIKKFKEFENEHYYNFYNIVFVIDISGSITETVLENIENFINEKKSVSDKIAVIYNSDEIVTIEEYDKNDKFTISKDIISGGDTDFTEVNQWAKENEFYNLCILSDNIGLELAEKQIILDSIFLSFVDIKNDPEFGEL